ncbi:hypothetical protein EV702DRAFT_1096513, partial [Suillus placidus]
TPSRNTSDPRLIVIHSFDINKPGAEVDDFQGGSILTGTARAGSRDPTKHTRGRHRCKPIFSEIISLHAESNHLQFAVPGGL